MTSLLLRFAIALLTFSTCSACASTPKAQLATGTIIVAAPAPDLSGVLALLGGEGSMAQACPIRPDLALTNSHVVGKDYTRYTWESRGRLGLLGSPKTTERDLFRDLARVAPWRDSSFPYWYPIAHDAPKPGDKVVFRGWDFRKRKDAFAPRDFESTVIRVFNGHVVYYPPGVPGTSGSCVLNERGEVVAINAFGRELEDANTVGGAVGVWGDLLELGQERGL